MNFKINYNKSTDSGKLEVCEGGDTTTLDISIVKERLRNYFPGLVCQYMATEFGPVYWEQLIDDLKEEHIKKIL